METPQLSIVAPGPGLQAAVRDASTPFVAVMARPDPALAGEMLAAAQAADADVAVAADPDPGLVQKALATAVKLALPPVRHHKLTDPLSGAFLVRRGTHMAGPVPLLAALSSDRKTVEVKATHPRAVRPLWPVLLQLVTLSFSHRENQRALRFGFVGLTGAVVNLALLALLHERVQLNDLLAVPIAIEASIIWNHFWNDRLTFRDRRRSHYVMRLLRFNAVSLVALAANFTVYATLTRTAGMHYLAAEAVAIVVAFGLNYLGNFHWTYGHDKPRLRPLVRRAAPWLPFVVIVASSAGFYFHDLDYVDKMVFDEHYYVVVAYQLNEGKLEDPCWSANELDHRPLNYEHPPLAKLILAASVQAFGETDATMAGCRERGTPAYKSFESQLQGEDPWVWRAPAALFGTLTVMFAGLAAGRLAGPLAAAAAALLVLTDGTVFTASRMATLDIFAVAFLMAAVYFATFRRGLPASMIALALGFSCKYSVAFAGPAVLALALWSRRTPSGWKTTLGAALAYAGTAATTWFVLYTPWLRAWIQAGGVSYAVRHLAELTVAALRWQAAGQQEHAYLSPPAEWLLVRRPTLIFVDRSVGGDPAIVRHVYSVGNPALYALAVAVFAFAWGPAVWHMARRDARAWWQSLGRAGQSVRIVSMLPAVSYGAFFVLTRSTYSFYMTLIAPLMAVAVATAMGVAWRRRRGSWWVLPGLALAVSWFIHFLPILRGDAMAPQEFERIVANWPWLRP